MERIGLTRDDLAIFGMASAPARARAAEERLRPRLEQVALRCAAPLSRLVGQPVSAAVDVPAEGAPGPATVTFFVAVEALAPPGPQFRFVISRGGVHARVSLSCQSPGRDALARKFARGATALARELAGNDVRCYDTWDGSGLPAPGTSDKAPFWREVAERLGRATGRLDVGMAWPEARAVLLSYEDLLPAFRTLSPVYRRLA